MLKQHLCTLGAGLRTRLLALLLVLPVALLGTTAAAQATFPEKPIHWLVPYPAGGGVDFLARTISLGWAPQITQSIVVENKPGGNTGIAAADTARAAPDGYTVLSADNGTVVFNPLLYKTLNYRVEDLAPVSLMGKFPMILVVTPSSGIATVAQFLERVRSSPDGMNFASAGAGSPHHMAMELLRAEAGLTMTHVPYRGAAPALVDVAGGQVPAMMVDLAAGNAFIKDGRVRPIAVANATRLAQLPDVPTFAEAGLPTVEAAALVGMVTTAGTPAGTIAALNQQVVAAIHTAEVRQKMIDFGVEPVGSTPQEYADLLVRERVRWQKVIQDLNISLD